MTHMFKSTVILSATILIFASTVSATETSPDSENSTQEIQETEAPTVSVEDFEKTQAALGLTPLYEVEVNTQTAVDYDVEIFDEDTLLAIDPEYEFNEQSSAFIGSTRMDDKGFVEYQRSAITPEGRVTEPLESLASVGIRSKF